jgi:hypothetical protein
VNWRLDERGALSITEVDGRLTERRRRAPDPGDLGGDTLVDAGTIYGAVRVSRYSLAPIAVYLYPAAFKSSESLIRTMAHESWHWHQADTAGIDQSDSEAREAELWAVRTWRRIIAYRYALKGRGGCEECCLKTGDAR